MKPWIIPITIMVLTSVASCEHRKCDYVRNAKGDQVCSEDTKPEEHSEQAKPEESDWREERGASKEEE